MKKTLVRMGFTGGVKPAYNPVAIAENAIADGRNISPDEVGVLKLCQGYASIRQSYGNGPVQGLTHAFGGLVVAWNQELYKIINGVSTRLREDGIGTSTTVPVNLIPWTYNGVETVFVQTGIGLYASTSDSCLPVVPYTPLSGEQPNLLRGSDGLQDPTCSVYKSTIGILRPGLAHRMAAAYGNEVYLSDPADPSYWPADQMLVLPNNGDSITALALWYGALIIFRHHDIWALFGTDMTDPSAILVLQDDSVGCKYGRTVAPMPDVGLIFLGQDNIYALSGVAGVENQLKARPIGNDILPHLQRAIADANDFAVGFFSRNEYTLTIPSAVEPERVFRYRTFPEAAWYVGTGPKASTYTELDGSVYCGSIDVGTVWKIGGPTFDGAAIPFAVAFKHEMLSVGPARVSRLLVFTNGTPTLQHLDASVVTDGIDIETVEMQLVGSADDNFAIGESVIGVGSVGRFSRIFVYEGRVRHSRGQLVQLHISGVSPNETIGIVGYALEYRPKDRARGIRSSVKLV